MSRYVKISSIGNPPLPVPQGSSDDNAANLILGWLEKNIEQALWDKPDILVLPETVISPAGYRLINYPGFYEIIGQRVFDLISEKAGKHKTNIIYGCYMGEDGKMYNVQRFVNREGKAAGCYKKVYPIIREIEMGICPGGKQDLMVSDCGTIAGSICFDLNFYPLLFQKASQRPDMVIFSSAYHGGIMQKVWAYFCRAHFIGSISGTPNAILNPAGVEIASTTNYFNIVTGVINLDGALFHIDFNVTHYSRYAEAKKYYGPLLKVSDPGYLAAVYMTSESPDFTIDDVVKRFEFEKLDDYFDRSIKCAAKARGEEFLWNLNSRDS